MDRIKTGIKELDTMIGGFPVGKTVLITGDAGSGKTIFGLQFANISCIEGKKTVYISTEESAEDLRQQGKSFGWRPEVGFEAGLERTVRWYRENEAWWRKLEWMKVVPVRTASGEVEYH